MRSKVRGGVAVAAALAVVMVAWLAMALQLDLVYDGQPAAGLFPVLLASVGIVFSLVVLSAEVRTGRAAIRASAGEADQRADWGALIKPALALAGLVAFLLLQSVLGFMIGLVLLLAFITFVVLRMTWWGSLIMTVSLTAFTYVVFDLLFNVPFPTGILGI